MTTYNGYTFQSRYSLRQALKYYVDLSACAGQGDTTSARILVDLNTALEVLAPRQRQAIELYLIRNIPAPMVAKTMGVIVRTVYYAVDEGLLSILRFLEDGKVALWTQEQIEFVRCNCATMTNEQLAQHTGRTAKAVANMLSRLRGNGQDLPRRTSRQVA